MNKTLIFTILTLVMVLPLVSAIYWHLDSENTYYNEYFICYNNQSGRPEGTTATINCTNTLSTASGINISTKAATNVNNIPGIFNATVNGTQGTYICMIGCGAATSMSPMIANMDILPIARADTLTLQAISSNASDIKVNLGNGLVLNLTVTNAAISGNASDIKVNLGNGLVINLTVVYNALTGNFSIVNGGISTVSNVVNASNSTLSTLGKETSLSTISSVSNYSKQALLGNTSNWFTSAYQTVLNTVLGAIGNNQTQIMSATSSISLGVNNTITNTTIIELTALGQATVYQIDAQINQSHGKGEYNNTASGGSTDISSLATHVEVATLSQTINDTNSSVGTFIPSMLATISSKVNATLSWVYIHSH